MNLLYVAHPRSGSSWIYRLLLVVLRESGVPHTSKRDHDSIAVDKARKMVGYRPHDKTKSRYRGKTVVLGIRDPKDIVVSMYFFFTRRNKWYCDTPMPEFIQMFLPQVCAYYDSWMRHRHVPERILMIRYEDMILNARFQVQQFLDFFEIPCDRSVVTRCIEERSFDVHQRMDKNRRTWHVWDGDPEMLSVRRGKVGGYVDYVNDKLREWMEGYVSDNLDMSLGYS